MDQVFGIFVFWLALFLISHLVLRRYYFPTNKALIGQLRLFACLVNLLILGLFYFDWVPPQPKGLYTGVGLILMGNFSLAFLFLLILVAAVLFLTPSPRLLKIAAMIEIFSTVFLFKVMTDLLPGATPLMLNTSAPIMAAFLLLSNSVAVLLLWHQLQKQAT